jgi:hypothetical protein
VPHGPQEDEDAEDSPCDDLALESPVLILAEGSFRVSGRAGRVLPDDLVPGRFHDLPEPRQSDHVGEILHAGMVCRHVDRGPNHAGRGHKGFLDAGRAGRARYAFDGQFDRRGRDPVPELLDLRDQVSRLDEARLVKDGRAGIGEVHRGAFHAFKAPQDVLDPRRTGGAAHPGHGDLEPPGGLAGPGRRRLAPLPGRKMLFGIMSHCRSSRSSCSSTFRFPAIISQEVLITLFL